MSEPQSALLLRKQLAGEWCGVFFVFLRVQLRLVLYMCVCGMASLCNFHDAFGIRKFFIFLLEMTRKFDLFPKIHFQS